MARALLLRDNTQIILSARHIHAWISSEERNGLQCRRNMINGHPTLFLIRTHLGTQDRTTYTGQSSGLGMCVVPILK